MKNLLNSIQLTKPGKNNFDLTHDVKLSCDMGFLVPTLALECIPGDKFHIGCDSLLRFQPLVAPVMHRVDVSMHYFFVPNRILWPNWEKFITNTPVGGNLPAVPFINILQDRTNYTKLMNYLGIPDPALNTVVGPVDEPVTAFAFAAYQMIWNEYYRDQNLSTAMVFELTDGDNTANTDLTVMQRRSWEHDYFTAALPFAQKGNPVSLPLQFADVPVKYKGVVGVDPLLDINTTPAGPVNQPTLIPGTGNILIGTNDPFAETSSLSGQTTINDLRRATKLQEWLEKAARGGSRLVENILIFFGVKAQDSRLQRPEYITGTKSPVIISEVLNTSDTATAPQGNMAGHAVSVTEGKYGGYYAQEHGYIIGVMSVMPKTAYMQGIPKHFLKMTDPFQYFWPQFANIGEQEVLEREIYAFDQTGDSTFGYVPRYAEYKFLNSRTCGDFQTTLDFWTLTRIFANNPQLNQAFVECEPREDIFAVPAPNVDSLLVHILHKIRAIRSMPKFGTPTF